MIDNYHWYIYINQSINQSYTKNDIWLVESDVLTNRWYKNRASIETLFLFFFFFSVPFAMAFSFSLRFFFFTFDFVLPIGQHQLSIFFCVFRNFVLLFDSIITCFCFYKHSYQSLIVIFVLFIYFKQWLLVINIRLLKYTYHLEICSFRLFININVSTILINVSMIYKY